MDALDRTKVGPPDDTPILPWYDGAFTHGFVALHPFFVIDGLNPDQCDHGTWIVERSEIPEDEDLLGWVDEQSAQRRVGKELDAASVARSAKRFGHPIAWRTILHQTRLADHCALDRTLRTMIGGLRRDLADPAASTRLKAYCSQMGIFLPTEGTLQPLMQARLAGLFRRAGFATVILGDEFGFCEMSVDLTALEQEQLWRDVVSMPEGDIKRVIAPDRSLLAWVHWDSFYTLLLANDARARESRIEDLFEGFWCSDDTTTYWLLEPAIPLAE